MNDNCTLKNMSSCNFSSLFTSCFLFVFFFSSPSIPSSSPPPHSSSLFFSSFSFNANNKAHIGAYSLYNWKTKFCLHTHTHTHTHARTHTHKANKPTLCLHDAHSQQKGCQLGSCRSRHTPPLQSPPSTS